MFYHCTSETGGEISKIETRTRCKRLQFFFHLRICKSSEYCTAPSRCRGRRAPPRTDEGGEAATGREAEVVGRLGRHEAAAAARRWEDRSARRLGTAARRPGRPPPRFLLLLARGRRRPDDERGGDGVASAGGAGYGMDEWEWERGVVERMTGGA